MHVDEQQILSLSRELWSTVLGLSVAPRDADATPDVDPTVACCIKASGAWQGAIVVECHESIARHAAAMLYASDGEATPEEELQDALNDLADMIGRRMQPLLPEATKLSRAGTLPDPSPQDAMAGLGELHLTCEGRPVRIALFESAVEPAGAA